MIVLSKLQDVWVQTAKKNAELFEQVFGSRCIPTNSAKTFEELNDFRVCTNVFSYSKQTLASHILKFKLRCFKNL